jgi:hypothetical protein
MPAIRSRITSQTLDVRTLGGLFARGNIPTAGGVVTVPVGSQCSLFLDQINANVTSGVGGGVTLADANGFGGRVPNGEYWTIFGFQVGIFEVTAAGLPVASAPAVAEGIAQQLTLTINMKGQTYNMGSVQPMPCGLGTNTLAMNGGRAVAPFRFNPRLPIALNPMDQWFLTFATTRVITLSAIGNQIELFVYMPASKSIKIGQLSGA